MRLIVLAWAAFGLVVSGCERGEPAIRVEQAWARETAPGQSGAAIYLRIENRGLGGDRLLSVATPRAGKATLHSVSDDKGVHRMREVDGLDLAPGTSAEFVPGGQHIMLSGLAEPLRAGASFPLSLTFERSGEQRVEVMIRPAGATGAMEHLK